MNYRKSIRFAAIFAVCLVSFGCDALYRVLDKEGAEEKELIGVIVPYKINPIVEEAQTLLYLYGYSTGKVDGVLGLRTRNALEKFQADNGLKPSRFLDRVTWKKLNIFKDNQMIAEHQLNVLLIQKLLKEAGVDPGTFDGKMGEKTKAAILEFQEVHGLKVDGKVGYQTLNKLSEYLKSGMQVKE